ncbi:Dos2-interacting transcription regulator of RNA-Pol-II-domain-containing protein [Zopfochytrium polystomum]|nr:Dos2-interacting transcription regulator of RNA-Pol-II-domain-containing protein [Zopfochytrium polystomum]
MSTGATTASGYVASFLADPDANEALLAVRSLAEGISARAFTLLSVVEIIGPQMTSSDPFERAKGVNLLSQVIETLPTENLDPKMVPILVDFLVERLHDQTSVAGAMRGITAMLEQSVLGRSDVLSIARKIFSELNVQTFTKPVRNLIFRTFLLLTRRHESAMKYLGPTFVNGFIHAMDGEKDPQNLLISFEIAETISRSFDISGAVNELFDVFYCYFPITFRPPPNDVSGITADDLKIALRKCFASNAVYSSLAIPVLLDKLQATSSSAKRDAIETLTACFPVYGAESFKSNLEDVWLAMRNEVLQAADAANVASALQALSVLAHELSRVPSASTEESLQDKFLTLVVSEVLAMLKDPELKNLKDGASILEAVAEASDPACTKIVNKIFPPVLEMLADSPAYQARTALLKTLTQVLSSARKVFAAQDHDDASPVNPFKVAIYTSCIEAVSSDLSPLRRAGAGGLFELFQSGLLSEGDELVIMYHFQVFASMPDSDLHGELAVYLTSMARNRPELVFNNLIVPFLDIAMGGGLALEVVSKFVERLAENSFQFKAMIEKLLSAADVVVSQAYFLVLSAVSSRLKFESAHPEVEKLLPQCADSVLFPVIRRVFSHILAENNEIAPELLDLAGSIARSIMRSLSIEGQTVVLRAIVPIFFGEDSLRSIGIASDVSVSFRNRDPNQIAVVRQVCRIFVDILCFSGPKSLGNSDEYVQVLEESVADPNLDAKLRSLLSVVLSDFWNKGEASSRFENSPLYNVFNLLSNGATATAVGLQMLETFLWLGRALAISSKSPATSDKILWTVIQQLNNPAYCTMVCENFHIVCGDDPSGRGYLTKESFANVRLLWKQKLFSFCAPRLVSEFKTTASAEQKPFYMHCLSQVMQVVPSHVMVPLLPEIFPLLLISLSSKVPLVQLASLKTVDLLISDSPDSVTSSIPSITDRLVGLCQFDVTAAPVEVRLAAVKCLGRIAQSAIPYQQLHPLKPRVLRGIQMALDDKKRLVRKEAANTRLKWFLLLGPKK